MALEYEKRRILDHVALERRRLAPDLERISSERRSCEGFVKLSRDIFDVFAEDLGARLDSLADPVALIDPELASERLADLFSGITSTTALIASVSASQADIPRDLYAVLDWFFGRCNAISESTNYILGNHTQLAALDLRQLMSMLFVRQTGFGSKRDLFPELTSLVTSTPMFVIFIPTTISQTGGFLDWPLIFHECVHAIDQLKDVVGSRFPHLPKELEALNARARLGDVDARDALWTKELICDFLAVHVGGPGFLWRFLRRYFSLRGIYHLSLTHPPVDKRVGRLIGLLEKRGFRTEARMARRLLANLMKDLAPSAAPAPIDLPDVADQIASDLESRVSGFDATTLQDTMTNKLRSDRVSLLKDIVGLRPVIADPACLYSITAFEEGCEKGKIPELLADYARLHAIEVRFHELGLRG